MAFVEHEHAGGPALYEYRPLVRAFVEERAPRLRGRDGCADRDRGAAARAGGGDLRARPRRAASRPRTRRSSAPCCSACSSPPPRRAAGSTGTTTRSIAPTPSSSARSSASAAPTRRSRRSSASRSRRSSSWRRGCGCASVADGELARHWPEASSMVPKDFGRETDRYCVLELRAALAGAEDPPDAPAEIADAVSAIRLATAAPLSAGPVLFETLDGRPYGIRPVLPIAATQPAGRGDAPRLVPRRARRRAARPARRSPTPTARSPRRSTAGSSRCSRTSRSAPSSSAPAFVGAARRDLAAAGRRAARDRAGGTLRRSTSS